MICLLPLVLNSACGGPGSESEPLKTKDGASSNSAPLAAHEDDTSGTPAADSTLASSSTTAADSTQAGPAQDAGGALPECHWPSLYDSEAVGACHAARTYLRCAYPSEVTGLCLSDDPIRCPGDPDGQALQCENQCGSHEYGLACGTIGPQLRDASAASQEPPSACRSLGNTPGGISFYCCPC